MPTKNPAAVALGKRAAAKLTHKDRSKGGRNRADSLTPERRREIALGAVAARGKKRAAKKKSGRRKSLSS